MAKFILTLNRTETITHTMQVEVSITKQQVLEELELATEDRADWRSYVEDFLNLGYTEEMIEGGKILHDDATDAEFSEPELESVDEA
jgi:hypothetical protein